MKNSTVVLTFPVFDQQYPLNFHIFMLWQSGWQISNFYHKIYIFDFHLLETSHLFENGF